MKAKWTYLFIFFILTTVVYGQEPNDDSVGEEDEYSQQIDPKDRLWSWKLFDDYTHIDTVQVDTITTGVHRYDPIFKDSYSNIFLGNKGSAYTSNLLSHKSDFNEFIFLNSLQLYFMQPADIPFFNTKTPYTNLTYNYAGPGRRSEENFSGFFTQNINKKWNYGVLYNLVSSIGLYESQKVDNRNFNFRMSYKSDKYSIHGAFTFNSIQHLENGGLFNDSIDYILNPGKYDFGQAENIPVKYTTASNSVENYQFFIHQSLNIGKINLNNSSFLLNDSVFVDSLQVKQNVEPIELPLSTVFHTFHVSSFKRNYSIADLDGYFDQNNNLPLYGNVYVDSLQTADSSRYTSIKNTFQIRFNEEANSFLKFGLRAYITNDIKNYKFQVAPDFITSDDGELTPVYRSRDTTLVSTFLGGQVFKNLGENFWWDIGGKLYFQGYKAGDIDVDANINSLYRVFKDTAGVYGKGLIRLRSAELFQEKYYSNHFVWDEKLKQEKIVNIEAGLNIPTRNFKLSWESKVFTDYIYWDYDALPKQSTKLINAFQLTMFKNFQYGAFHSDNKLAYQYTSNKELYPVPEFAGFSSNYFNFYLAQRVLQVQIGMDVRYHSEYYAPAYMPATGQFYLQNKQKIGNYPFMDAFMNLQLKRARIFVKLDHFNQSLLDRNYFLTLGYPYPPIRFKWGVSWNFYD